MADWLIRNALVVNESRRLHADVRIQGGRIAAIAATLPSRVGEKVIDAAGRLLLPGMIDDQVHFREPGLEYKADIRSESRAAVAGGITSVMEMPNTRPPTITREALEAKHALGAKSALTNYSFYFGATNDNLEEIQRLDRRATCGIKVFMGASTGNMLVNDPRALEGIFRDAPTLVVTHCEDTPTIDANLAAERARYGDDIPTHRHPYIRSAEACYKSSSLAVELARRHDARLHVLHVSTARELELFQPGPVAGKRITAETCVHYLCFSEQDYATRGNFIKCNPAIKGEADRAALLAALAEGRIDVLATDHAPHTLEEKNSPYEKAPSGLPLVQYALVSALQHQYSGRLSVEQIVEHFAHAPATLFDVAERGFIREGYWADLTLVDLDAPQTVKRSDVLSKCGWSPFEGDTFKASIVATWVNGHLAWREGVFDESQRGRRLEFAR